jgi:alanine transaminase
MSPAVLKAQYAVRGAIAVRAGQINEELKTGKGAARGYDKVIMCNIGNPQSLAQPPLTFARSVIAAATCPSLLKSGVFPADVCSRADAILSGTDSYSIGAYTHSQGLASIRRTVADFIDARDGCAAGSAGACNPNHLYLTDGASPGIKAVLQCLVSAPTHGVLLPIPQYPLYSATIALQDSAQLDYNLDEEKGWAFDPADVERAIGEGKKKGIDPRAIVIINPGNPTGQCMTKANIEDAIEIARDENLVILADEVYQENVYDKEKQPFHSFRKVLKSMGSKYDSVELASFHSVSKGVMGECGLRGGYMELVNVDQSGIDEIYKLVSINLCSNTVGQVAVDVMCNPPKAGDPSYELYRDEYDGLYESLKRRAAVLSKALNEIGSGMSSQLISGAMYAFPQIKLPPKAVAAAKDAGVAPDAFYCLRLLEEAGICVVPGSGFGQKDGTFHFRTTLLPPEKEIQQVVDRLGTFHRSFVDRYS